MAEVKKMNDPSDIYDKFKPLWTKSRVACGGEHTVKAYDDFVDTLSFGNLLIPFSPSMTATQYTFYKAEAEYPGIVPEFKKMLVGGLLRKQPVLQLPDSAPEEAHDWIIKEFAEDDSPLVNFLGDCLAEEVETSRSWLHIEYPKISEELTVDEAKLLKPYPILMEAESVINWRVQKTDTGNRILDRVVVKGSVEDFTENEFHPVLLEKIWVHELVEGKYQIRTFVQGVDNGEFEEEKDSPTIISFNDETLDMIPIWPLNGNIEPVIPLLYPIIEKEMALYNKISRRNHLLYGAATFTPWVASDMDDEAFQSIVAAGLGSWLHLRQGDTIGVLDTPTEALADMDRAILAAFEEMAKMGIRMLAPETVQSGVALSLRNAAQTAQLGSLSIRISNVMSQIIAFMLNWRYDLEIKPSEVVFSLTEDFDPLPLGADWLRLATEWYEAGLIPRSIWLKLLKQNDMIAPDYDDEAGLKEINDDELIVNKQEDSDYLKKLEDE